MHFQFPGARGAPIVATLSILFACLTFAGMLAADPLDEAVPRLADRSFMVKQAAVEAIAISGDERALPILKALAAGELYTRKETPSVVRGRKSGASLRLVDPLTGQELGEAAPGAVKKIILNNAMRVALRVAIAAGNLTNPNPALRLQAAREMLGDTSPLTATALAAQLDREQDPGVRKAIALALAVSRLGSQDAQTRLAAVKALEGSLYPEARNALFKVTASDPDPAVQAAAVKALAAIDQNLVWNARVETLFFGLSLGSVLVLAAIGLAITFGVMGVINMAHGELIMLGAYTTYLVQSAFPGWLDYSLFAGHSGGLSRLRTLWDRHRADCDPLSLRPAPGDPARHLRASA